MILVPSQSKIFNWDLFQLVSPGKTWLTPTLTGGLCEDHLVLIYFFLLNIRKDIIKFSFVVPKCFLMKDFIFDNIMIRKNIMNPPFYCLWWALKIWTLI